MTAISYNPFYIGSELLLHLVRLENLRIAKVETSSNILEVLSFTCISVVYFFVLVLVVGVADGIVPEIVELSFNILSILTFYGSNNPRVPLEILSNCVLC